MESRKRVLDALNHKQPDRVPVDLGSHRSSNFSVHAYKNLREYLGLKPDTLYLYDLIQQLIIPGDDVLDMFGSDVVALGRDFRDDPGYWKDWVMQDGTEIKIPAFVDFRKEGGDSWLYNVNGKRIGVQKSGCLYVEQLVFPRRGDDSEDFSNLEEQFHDVMWFEVGAPPAPLGYEGDDLLKRKETAKSLRAGTTGAIYGLFGGTFFEGCQWIFSMEDAFIHMAADKKLMKNYLDKMLEIHKKNLEYYLDACGDELDVLGFSDDLGMQTGPQISPEMYREMFKPYHKELWGYAKKLKPHLKLGLHCCGGIVPLLPDIIDAGMDAMNPVQISCAGMDVEFLKREFGKDITFWGGGCDTQTILPTATPAEVKDHVRKNIEALSKDGGFIFQQVHNIMANVPPENIVAMFEAVNEYK